MIGYVKIPHEVLRNEELTTTEKVVWSLIAGTRDGYNPTIAQYCAMVPCHADTWRAVVKNLERYGMIAVEHFGNGVTYTANTDANSWVITAVKGMKNSEGRKISHPMKNSYPKDRKISHPLVLLTEEHNIEEQENARAPAREKLKQEIMVDLNIELACKSYHISVEQYKKLADEIISEWTFADLEDREWTKIHFISVLRRKANDLKRNGRENEQDTERTGGSGNPLARAKIHTVNIG